MLQNPKKYRNDAQDFSEHSKDAAFSVPLAELRVLFNNLNRQVNAIDKRSYNNALLLAGMTAKFGFLTFGITAIMNVIMGCILYFITRGLLQPIVSATGG